MIPGETSTGSKRSDALWGAYDGPRRMTRSDGCRVWDEHGREYLDTIMALGAVGLGYAHPAVTQAVERAVREGGVGPLPPVAEARVAERLAAVVPGAEAVRFLKTGAEAVAAAVRIARVVTGRDGVASCGYHGWLDWSQEVEGVPRAVTALHRPVRFNDVAALDALLADPPLAAIVVEPVIDEPPAPGWVAALHETAGRMGALLVVDEIKTCFRLGPGGAVARYGIRPDLVVLGKALGNGFPIAAVTGPASLMEAATKTWISSTLATEFVALAAAEVVIEQFERRDVGDAIARAGMRFLNGLRNIAAAHPAVATGVLGIPEFCYLTFRDEATSGAVAAAAATRGLLFKRDAYNFVSLAHDDAALDVILTRLEEAVAEVEQRC